MNGAKKSIATIDLFKNVKENVKGGARPPYLFCDELNAIHPVSD